YFSRGEVEPELVAPDRTAEADIGFPVRVDRVGSLSSSVAQLLREVAALHAAVGKGAEEGGVERIAAFARNTINPYAANRVLRVARRGVEHDLLRPRRIQSYRLMRAGVQHRDGHGSQRPPAMP